MSHQERVTKLADAVRIEIDKRLKEPLIVSIMGQTGVGKSTLINALFNTHLKTDPVRPCTKEIECVVTRDESGHELWFYDMPGIGEAGEVNEQYFKAYSEQLLRSDVVLWALHVDNRSVAFDQDALHRLLGQYDRDEQVRLMSKITFVLTKADLLSPPPWVFVREGEVGAYIPSKGTKEILAQKAAYSQEAFLEPYEDLIVSETFNDSRFRINDSSLGYDEHAVWYHGHMDETIVAHLKQKYPKHARIFERLHDNYRVLPCSSLFRYGLSELMLVVLNKVGRRAVGRFSNFISTDELNQVRFEDARQYCNTIIFDRKAGTVVFDLTKHTL